MRLIAGAVFFEWSVALYLFGEEVYCAGYKIGSLLTCFLLVNPNDSVGGMGAEGFATAGRGC